MIALAEHLRRSPYGMGRSVMLLIALTAALIVGLLAMHSLSTPTAHAEPAATASVHETGAGHSHDAPPLDDGCLDCGGHEAMLAMACVLALLAVAVLFLLPLRRRRLECRARPCRAPFGCQPDRAIPTAVSSRSLHQPYVMAAR